MVAEFRHLQRLKSPKLNSLLCPGCISHWQLCWNLLAQSWTATTLMTHRTAGGCRWATRCMTHTGKWKNRERAQGERTKEIVCLRQTALSERKPCGLLLGISARGSAASEESQSALPSSIQTHAGNYLTLLQGLENVSGLEMEALSQIKYVVHQAENIWSGAVREDGGGGGRVSAEALL